MLVSDSGGLRVDVPEYALFTPSFQDMVGDEKGALGAFSGEVMSAGDKESAESVGADRLSLPLLCPMHSRRDLIAGLSPEIARHDARPRIHSYLHSIIRGLALTHKLPPRSPPLASLYPHLDPF